MPRKSPAKTGEGAKARGVYALHPWRCDHRPDESSIVAYVEASGAWETVAMIPATSGASAEAVAQFIARAVNATQQNRDLLQAALGALEEVLETGLTFSTEMEADRVIQDIKQVTR